MKAWRLKKSIMRRPECADTYARSGRGCISTLQNDDEVVPVMNLQRETQHLPYHRSGHRQSQWWTPRSFSSIRRGRRSWSSSWPYNIIFDPHPLDSRRELASATIFFADDHSLCCGMTPYPKPGLLLLSRGAGLLPRPLWPARPPKKRGKDPESPAGEGVLLFLCRTVFGVCTW
jgi:hypothetical protein